MSNIDKQALREEFRFMQVHYSDPADRARQVIYIAAEALLDELEHYKSREERVTKLVMDNSTSWDALYKKLEAAEKRIAEHRKVLNSLAAVARRYLPDYDEHPEIQAADELLESAAGIKVKGE
ncbi:TPA: ead/Ea22-like family protein [Salmonella enterica subsp. enterica serovar Thompson]|nr:ead/Ea22-like family protein [Salmonella enterica]EBV7177696.1 ead/Ea22-like family protein [Salmonella enterica subsp. enterica serovar Thompson]ECI8012236.1 ead/Ea22-like family protein [Salmonella enterica subsp. enterica]EAX5653044.1 ead/Ea22-like family protein [Salmonella enterica]EBM7136322.1 ead/Ea22-like family protein [Salmonella enterica]ECW0959285.1 ead/Ea22-like family protein [Salmonella enterica subsp. enterica]